jgi:hypothetical protein
MIYITYEISLDTFQIIFINVSSALIAAFHKEHGYGSKLDFLKKIPTTKILKKLMYYYLSLYGTVKLQYEQMLFFLQFLRDHLAELA